MAAVRSGRTTALSKDDGGVRGIVTGDVVRRLVAAQSFNNWAQQSMQPQRPINMHSPPGLGAGGRKRCYTLFLSWPEPRQEGRPN